MSPCYYNDSDPFVCAWLRNLIAAGHLPPGEVDERPIQEVMPDDVRGYRQAHFFAGIGGWPYALELAGWGDRPVWTGSCPCQPFSAAGKRQSHADERHLWPAWFHLIQECRPLTIFGEQVSGAAGLGWLDAVALDLETLDYAVGACVLGAHSVGAPHLRQRLYFVGDAFGAGSQGHAGHGDDEEEPGRNSASTHGPVAATGPTSRLDDDAAGTRRDSARERPEGEARDEARLRRPERGRGAGELADAERGATERQRHDVAGAQGGAQGEAQEWEWLRLNPWAGGEFIACRDGKARPVEPSIFPLAHGIPNRVGLLRGAGNAIVPQVAAAFVSAYLEVAPLAFDFPHLS